MFQNLLFYLGTSTAISGNTWGILHEEILAVIASIFELFLTSINACHAPSLSQVAKLGSEKTVLQRERSELQRQVSDLGGAVDKLNKEKVRCMCRAASKFLVGACKCGIGVGCGVMEQCNRVQAEGMPLAR